MLGIMQIIRQIIRLTQFTLTKNSGKEMVKEKESFLVEVEHTNHTKENL